ncbi:hypothetical protein GCM10009430_37730 [Aquimarina litoralis]|uniref:DUF6794 domain-containing protein n=2 Tax=Aquimarina litoralis TaxID=584605 RepID=A0ABN1J4J6_9FLAO
MFVLTLLSCQNKRNIPSELIYSFEYLNDNWNKEEINKFKNISENDTTPRNYHFGIGMHIRNNLLRHNEKSDSIVKFFNDLKIEHYDYMSSIILTSYNRYLNNTDIKLMDQVNGILESLKPTVDCQNRQREKAEKLYSKLSINDSIQVQMPVSEMTKNSVISYDCPNVDWNFDSDKHLLINGVVTQKYIRKDSSSDSPQKIYRDYHLKLRILEMNNPEIKYFMNKIAKGDEIDFSLEYSFNIK